MIKHFSYKSVQIYTDIPKDNSSIFTQLFTEKEKENKQTNRQTKAGTNTRLNNDEEIVSTW